MAAFFYQTSKIADDGASLLGGATGLTVARLSTGLHLYVTAQHESAMSVFDLSAGGVLELVQQASSAGARKLDGAGDLTWVSLPDKEYVVTTAFYENAVQGYSLTAAGRLFSDDIFFDDVDLTSSGDGGRETALFGADSIETYDVSGVTHAVIGARNDDGVAIIRYLTGGVIEHVRSLFDRADVYLDGVEDVAIANVGAKRFLIGVSPIEQGVSIYRLIDSGLTQNVFNLSSGSDISLGRVNRIETLEAGGETFLYLAGRGNWPIHAFRLGDDGTLTLIDRVTGEEAANVFNPFAMRAFEADGKDFLAVGGDTGGISVFRIGAKGGLTLVSEHGHLRPSQTDPTREIIVEQVGDKTYLITAGQLGDGVTVTRFFTPPKGVARVGDEANDTLLGTRKGDVLIGDDGNDTLRGKAGHDRLLDGPGKDLIWGGPGRDTFEFHLDGKQDKLRDFQDGLDVIDLSASTLIRDMGDLTLTQINANTVLLSFGEENLFINGYQGADLSVGQFTPDDFIFA